MTLLVLVGAVFCGLLAVVCLPLLAVPANGELDTDASACQGATTQIEVILDTIRTLESGGDYQAHAVGASASGAYQYVDATWRHWAEETGINTNRYPSAADAPPRLQDRAAAANVRHALEEYEGDVTIIPLHWYYPAAIGNETLMDVVPMPEAGNTLTPREYQTKWLDTFQDKIAETNKQDHSPSDPVAGNANRQQQRRRQATPTSTPTLVCDQTGGQFGSVEGITQLSATDMQWGSYSNGQIPQDAMDTAGAGFLLHPDAARSFNAMAAALHQEAGLTIESGGGYRSYTAQVVMYAGGTGATPGHSNHGWGLAVDISVLVPGNPYRTVEEAFASREYRWLCRNARRFGWGHPDWARPTTVICPTPGKGTGGGSGGVMEPWHWEFFAFANQ